MKKFVKPLVIASAVAAVAGIGAVSFAKWTVTESVTDNTPTIGLGYVTTMAFGTNGTATGLLPWNQVSDTTVQKAAVSVVIKVPKNYEKTTMDLKVEQQAWTGTDINTKFYVTADSTKVADGKTTSDWTACLIGSSGVTIPITIDDGDIPESDATKDKTVTLYFMVDSSATGDMGKTFTVKYTLTKGTTDRS